MRVHIPIVDLPADNVPLIVVSVPLVAHDGDAWRVPATPKPRSTSIDQQTGLVRAASMGEWRHPQGRHVLMRVVRMSASRLPLGQNGGEIITARIRTGWSITWRANRHRRGACGPTGTADALGARAGKGLMIDLADEGHANRSAPLHCDGAALGARCVRQQSRR
jgi:hypothetical protein